METIKNAEVEKLFFQTNPKDEFEIFIDALSCNKLIEDDSNFFGESNQLFLKPTLNENGYEISEEMTNDIDYYI
jgi:hypothetical protein